ncbi:MAG: hypothetical protein KF691_14055 [Phycisphaeraceae bacterium]|nr:hypothetical protein [Phycisphaeraceae bacterium]
MNENSEILALARRTRQAPYRRRTKTLFWLAAAVMAFFFLSAFGAFFFTLPDYGFVSLGEGSVALKLPEQFGNNMQRSSPASPWRLRFGRNWPLAQRYYIAADPIPRKGDDGKGRWYDPSNPHLFWMPDARQFPAFSRWPIWILALLMLAAAALSRVIEVRRWRKGECCGKCGYSLRGLEIAEGQTAVCPECGASVVGARS